MLQFNGKYLAVNRAEQSQMEREGLPVAGFYRSYKRTISILDIAGNKVGVVSDRRVIASASRRPGGYFYTYRVPDIIGEYDSYMQQCEEVDAALDACHIEPRS